MPAPVEKANSSPKVQATSPDEDKLNVFMCTLGYAARAPAASWAPHQLTPCSSRSASPTLPAAARGMPADCSREEVSIEEAARHADRDRRSLAPAAEDHSKVEYARLERVLRKAPQVTPEELVARAEAVVVTLSNATVCPIDTVDELSDGVPQQLLRDVIHDFNAPTSVQRSVVPCSKAGHDVVGTAPAGCGTYVKSNTACHVSALN